jgi:hypothetical protein
VARMGGEKCLQDFGWEDNIEIDLTGFGWLTIGSSGGIL